MWLMLWGPVAACTVSRDDLGKWKLDVFLHVKKQCGYQCSYPLPSKSAAFLNVLRLTRRRGEAGDYAKSVTDALEHLVEGGIGVFTSSASVFAEALNTLENVGTRWNWWKLAAFWAPKNHQKPLNLIRSTYQLLIAGDSGDFEDM